MKVCVRCKKEKEITEFGIRKASKDGRHYVCKECLREANKRDYYKHRGKLLERKRKDYFYNPEKYKERRAEWNRNNPEKCRAWSEKWKKENSEAYKKIMKKAYRKYGQNNKDKIAAKAAKRRAVTKESTPSWVYKNEWYSFLISEIYHLSSLKTELAGIEHHVDHIVPLTGKKHPNSKQYVCGLHVPWNLQVITSESNLQKSCYKWPDM